MKHRIVFFFFCMLAGASYAKRTTSIAQMKVEYQKTPIALEEEHPRFSWQMLSDDHSRNCYQKAYAITVTDVQGKVLWNSGKVANSKSLNVRYAGKKLMPQKRYQWNLTVWNQDDCPMSQTSWFEMGLMNHSDKSEAWKGAKWVGLPESSNVLHSQYLPVFRFSISLQLDKRSKSKQASFLLGVNDRRLMDANKNIYHLQNHQDASYIKLELNTQGIDDKKEATVAVYRVGYAKEDKQDVPLKVISIPASVINQGNRYLKHHFEVAVNLGYTEIFVDGQSLGIQSLNPIGQGGDFLAFPVLADQGIAVNKSQMATFSEAEVRAFRSPGNVIVKVDKLQMTLDGRKSSRQVIINPSQKSMPMLRTSFKVDKEVASARLYVTARGVYDVYMNGKRVNEEYLNPGITQYNKTHTYQTYDVTEHLLYGQNAIGAILGEGWWSGGLTFQGENWNYFGDRQSLLARLYIRYKDGSSQDVVTSPSLWQYYDEGPVKYGSLFQGEVYDACREGDVEGWSLPSYDAGKWRDCVEIPLTEHVSHDGWGTAMAPDDYSFFKLVGQNENTILPVCELPAKSVKEVRKGVFIYDMGQNMVGVPKIKFCGLSPSTQVTMRYAEVLYPNLPEYAGDAGMMMMENIRAAMAQDIYVAKGGIEVFTPRFTYHGYRYIEITGLEAPLPLENVKGIVLSSIKKISSAYQTSDDNINRLWENVKWSSMGNFLSIPTDCPQRNERMGWAGDISVFSRTATYMTDAAVMLRSYLQAMRDVQTPEGRFQDIAPIGGGFGGLLWGSAGITVPWECYQQYNDTTLIREHYAAMKKYIEYVKSHYIDSTTDIIVQKRQWGDLGDWLGLEDERNDKSLLWECYYIYDLELMQKMAGILGFPDDVAYYGNLHKERVELFNASYVNPSSGKTIASSFNKEQKGKLVDTQTSYVLPLVFDIIKPALRTKFIENLKSTLIRSNKTDKGEYCPPYSLMTGFIGTAWISKALSDAGQDSLAYRLLRQKTYPSWLYPVTQGATTIWERLNSYTHERGFGGNNRMNSFNHYSFGAVAAWMYNFSLGIQRDEENPGFKHFLLQPEPDEPGGLQYASGFYDSMYGRIESKWERKGNRLVYSFVIPANTSATVSLPAASQKSVLLDGKKLKKNQYKLIGNKYVLELASGQYQFTVCEN